ncbi:myotubularin-related protein 10-B [Bacillus rossius redtenbacheri]|uniref:myotubularin-related protein 10-B n=1 Tax=Bacillus rossius redtenbacheri TaxID=93214 RepID=UPI002FDEB4AC
MFAQLCEMKQGKSGVLIITNFKLSFITTESRPRDELGSQQNMLLGEHDVCLSNVDVVYQTAGDKKRRLSPGTVPEKVKGLHVVCKNMRVFTFSFKFSPVGHGKNVTNALLHYAFPKRHQLLFAYDFREPYYNCGKEVCLFRSKADWERELMHTGCAGWRLSSANHSFQMSISLPQWLVVPGALLDWQLGDAAGHFRGRRPPVWTWGTPAGAALVRLADIDPAIPDRMKENVMLEYVRKSHPNRTQPLLVDLGKELPSPRDVQASYARFRELCVPDNFRQFWLQDNNFYGLLDSTRWLSHVSAVLSKSLEAAEAMLSGVSVAIQENEGRDMCCTVASLVQLLLDPLCRTLAGFQALVQKEWVALGHPFCTRLGHIHRPDNEKSYLFLFFLDCVWQLLDQCPSWFEFTETYLTTLWDSAQMTVFDTFLFDCERDRTLAANEPNNPMILRSVWDWGEQFLEKDIALFYSPLFVPSERDLTLVPVRTGPPHMSVWKQCYFRWMRLVEIPGGGMPQLDLQLRILLSEITSLRRGLAEGSYEELSPRPSVVSPGLGSFYPFGGSGGRHGSLLASTLTLDNCFGATESLIDSQSLLNAD